MRDRWTDIIVTPCGHRQRYVAPRPEYRYLHHSHLLGDACLTCRREGVMRSADGVICRVQTGYSTPPPVEAASRPARRSRRRETLLEDELVETTGDQPGLFDGW